MIVNILLGDKQENIIRFSESIIAGNQLIDFKKNGRQTWSHKWFNRELNSKPTNHRPNNVLATIYDSRLPFTATE